MIGRVILPDGTSAALSDDGIWECENDLVARELNLECNPNVILGVFEAVPFGRPAIRAAAKLLGGKVELAEAKTAPAT